MQLWCTLLEILKYKPENVHFLKVWTDCPNSQFKNKYVMGAIEMLSEKKTLWPLFMDGVQLPQG